MSQKLIIDTDEMRHMPLMESSIVLPEIPLIYELTLVWYLSVKNYQFQGWRAACWCNLFVLTTQASFLCILGSPKNITGLQYI